MSVALPFSNTPLLRDMSTRRLHLVNYIVASDNLSENIEFYNFMLTFFMFLVVNKCNITREMCIELINLFATVSRMITFLTLTH